MAAPSQFDRYVLPDDGTFAPLFRDRGALVYVLEFANGEQYVGLTRTMTQRFASHRRAWNDITAIQIRDVDEAELARVERETIRSRRAAGLTLRNKAHNQGHNQPSPLDDVVPVKDQQHWVLGDGGYDRAAFAEAAQRPSTSHSKFINSEEARIPMGSGFTVADLVVGDLAAAIAFGIPDAVSTELTYWMISDYPSTSRGRLVTLNVGNLQVLYVPRRPWPLTDTTAGTFEEHVTCLYVAAHSRVADDLPGVVDIDRGYARHPQTPVDRIFLRVGMLSEVLRDQVALKAFRELVLDLMRSGTSTRWAHHHGAELAKNAYQFATIPGIWE